MNAPAPDSPRVLAPPPLIAGGFFAAGYGLDRLFPGVIGLPASEWAGGALIVAGGGLGLWMIVTFLRARTAIEPWKPASALVTGGPFRLSRNPAYAGLALVHAGAALWLGAPFALLALIPSLATLHYKVVLREEAYLERRFGTAYSDYRKRVRRWL